MRTVEVYWPQCPNPAFGRSVPFTVFFDYVSKVMDNHLTPPGKLLVTGDFNFHVDIPNDPVWDAKCVLHVLDMLDLHQHGTEPTHKDGRTLDHIITKQCQVILLKMCMLICKYQTIVPYFSEL